MIALRIPGATRYLGAPMGWEPDAQGHCAHLAIRDVEITEGPCMMSMWEPTPAEIESLQHGAPIILWVVGVAHPPVSISVGLMPEDQAP